jgi:H2-forming N5,N10-methylenetetrahydromethanopterin dehydrogenase-like enzyme
MEMVPHKDVAVQSNIVNIYGSGEKIEKGKAIDIIDKDILAPVATMHHMVEGAGILYAERSSHELLVNKSINFVNNKDLTPSKYLK